MTKEIDMQTVDRISAILGLTLLLVATGLAHAGLPATVEEGVASYYDDSLHGNETASGEAYDKNAMTAAHRTLPFGTRVRVTYPKTGKSVEVVINDRGPHATGRIIDLSGAAAKALGLIDDGTGEVRLEVISP
jgi:peptidoglycan lytic transglycosylase